VYLRKYRIPADQGVLGRPPGLYFLLSLRDILGGFGLAGNLTDAWASDGQVLTPLITPWCRV